MVYKSYKAIPKGTTKEPMGRKHMIRGSGVPGFMRCRDSRVICSGFRRKLVWLAEDQGGYIIGLGGRKSSAEGLCGVSGPCGFYKEPKVFDCLVRNSDEHPA